MNPSGATTNDRGGLLVALVATTFAALMPAMVAGRFRDAFAAFGMDLPAITTFFLHHHWWLLSLPAAMLVLWALWESRPNRGRRIAVIGMVCATATLMLAVAALYLPIYTLSGAI